MYKKIFKKCFSLTKNKNNLLLENAKLNIYRGVTVDLRCDMFNELDFNNLLNDFEDILESSLNSWKQSQIRSITVSVPEEQSKLIHYFVSKGFYFHHTSNKNLYLCKWLEDKEPNKLPKYAHHCIGVGACIINENKEILLVKEKYSSYSKKPLWKFVTGLVEEGETLENAVIREVKEEVNLDVKTEGIIIFSELFPNIQLCSDLCFFNLCTIKGDNNNKDKDIQMDLQELIEAKFFDFRTIDQLIKEKETTVLTAFTFNKIKDKFNICNSLNKSTSKLEDDIKLLKLNNLILSKKDTEKYNKNLKHINVYH